MGESIGHRVLIVDDSPANLKVARVALEAVGFEVRTAIDGESAWQELKGYTPDVILMDLQMPGVDGFELTRRIKADPTKHEIPIIAVTAYAMVGDRERALAAGCDDYVAKPIDPITLPELVAGHVLRRHSIAPAEPRDEQDAILVIDDNPTTRKMIRVALESDGHRVREACDARSALTWIEEHRPRLVLQDLVLPDMDGLELMRMMRARPHGRSVPILCLSGFLARIDEARTLDEGFAALLVKPVDPIRLLEIVRVHLQTPRSSPPPQLSSENHVLVVDDDPLQRRLAEYHLHEAGLRVTTATSAGEALRELKAWIPDAVVSDVLMPEMDGFELCLLLRQNPRFAGMPVILISAHHTDEADHRLARDVGASALVTRSGDWVHALRVVCDAIAQRAGEAPPDSEDSSLRDRILRRALAQIDRQVQANARLGQQCLLQAAQLSVLAGVADALARETRLEGMLGDVLAVCLDLAGISKGALYLRRNGVLEPRHWIGFGNVEVQSLGTFFGHWHVLEDIISAGQVCAIPSTQLEVDTASEVLSRAHARSALVVPVMWGERFYGALLLAAGDQDLTGNEPAAFARVLGGQLGQAIGLAEAFTRLHASEAQFRALVDSMDHVTVLDRDQLILGVYGRGLEREGITAATVLGKTLQEVVGAFDSAAHQAAQTRALSGDSVTYEWSIAAGPQARHFQSSVFPIRDAGGRIDAVVRVSRDVTEQQRLQAQVMVSDRMASVGMLAAGVAHEINNPLMAVLGNIQLVLDGTSPGPGDTPWSPQDVEEALRDALDAGQRVESIVRDLRLFSRAEEPRVTAVDVHAVLESTLRMARNEIRHRAQLVKDYALVPPVRGSDSRLGQVFLNLLINAAQAIPEGRADHNQIRVVTRVDDQNRVVVEIHDTGPGIPPELRAKLFTPFVTTKPVGVGTGLGLAICQRIVAGFGGEIGFESEVGRGTLFRVILQPDRESPAPTRIVPRVEPALRRGRVLVIDDDPMLQTLIRKALSYDHDVVASRSAQEALELLQQGTSFDVILCDVMMPVMTGADFYRELTQRRPELAAQVVFLTGGAFTPSAREFLATSAVPCLEKPFELNALRAFVNDRVK